MQHLILIKLLDKLYQRVFSSNDGKKLLIHLKKTYLDTPTWTPGYDSSFGYFRDGQNTIIREILIKMKRATYERK